MPRGESVFLWLLSPWRLFPQTPPFTHLGCPQSWLSSFPLALMGPGFPSGSALPPAMPALGHSLYLTQILPFPPPPTPTRSCLQPSLTAMQTLSHPFWEEGGSCFPSQGIGGGEWTQDSNFPS